MENNNPNTCNEEIERLIKLHIALRTLVLDVMKTLEDVCWDCVVVQKANPSTDADQWMAKANHMYKHAESLATDIADALGVQKTSVSISKILGVDPADLPPL